MRSMELRFRAATLLGVLLLLTLAAMPVLAAPYPVFVAAQLITMVYLALAVDLSHSLSRVLSFCSGTFFALGAYGLFYIVHHVSAELLLALPLTIGMAMLCGSVAAVMVTRMRGAHAAVVGTLAIGSVIALLASAMTNVTGGEDGFTFRAPLRLAGLALPGGVNLATYMLALLPIAFLSIAYAALYATPFGTVLRAIGANEVRSAQLGFNVGLRRVVMFSTAAGISALGGAFYCVLIGHISTALFAPVLSLNGVLWATVGGLGAPFGALIGTAIIYPSVEFAAGIVRSVDAVVGGLLVLTALCFPRGISGALEHLARKGDPVETANTAPPILARRELP